MNNRPTKELTPQQIAKIVLLLDEGTQTIDGKILAQLAESRKQAVAALAGSTPVARVQPALAGWGRLLELSHHNDFRLGLLALGFLIAISAALISSPGRNSNPINTDSLLLSSELPPETFDNKEFVLWLEHTSHLSS